MQLRVVSLEFGSGWLLNGLAKGVRYRGVLGIARDGEFEVVRAGLARNIMHWEDGNHIARNKFQLTLRWHGGAVKSVLNSLDGIDGEGKSRAIVIDGEPREVVRETAQHDREMHRIVGVDGIGNIVVVLHTETQRIKREQNTGGGGVSVVAHKIRRRDSRCVLRLLIPCARCHAGNYSEQKE